MWSFRHHSDVNTDGKNVSTTLPSDDTEKVVINEHTHTITEITRNEKGQTEIKKSFLPPTAAVEYKKDGSVNISKRSWGTELVPTVGIAYGSDLTPRDRDWETVSQSRSGQDAQHNSWMKEKIDTGWVYGKTKDAEAKTHPCIVPFEELPEFQQKKDGLFCAIVDALK